MKNQYNPLFEPKVANHICISGQLLLTDLIEKLEDIPTVQVLNANTDGIMLGYNPKHEPAVEAVVSDWEQRTQLNMEYTEIHRISQKDVNNYVMVAGATYLIKEGQRQYTKDDKRKVSVKGGYVSLYKGGDFKNNSLVIVHKAIAEYFLNGTPPADTVNNAENILDFQIICKTGHTYDGCVYMREGNKVPVQRCNRVYASLDSSHGTLYKVKGDRLDKIASIPEHCLIDNGGDNVKLEDIDKQYYIDLAQKRINDYLGVKPDNKPKKKTTRKKETKTMATAKTTTTKTAQKEAPAEPLNVYQKLALARANFRQQKVEKTGKNMHLAYKYFQLSDIVPVAEGCLQAEGLIFLIDFCADGSCAFGHIINTENPVQTIDFSTPCCITEPNKGTTALQAIGSAHTYIRRYLWLLAMDIVEQDVFEDNLRADGASVTASAPSSKSKAPATQEERKEIAKTLATPSEEGATDAQKASIKRGLKKLQEMDSSHNEYVLSIVNEMKAGASSKRAEEIISEIGSKLYPEN